MSERAKDFLERLAFTVAFVVVGLAIPYLTGINEAWVVPIVAGLQIIKNLSPSRSAIPTPRASPIPRHCPCHRRNYQLLPPTRPPWTATIRRTTREPPYRRGLSRRPRQQAHPQHGSMGREAGRVPFPHRTGDHGQVQQHQPEPTRGRVPLTSARRDCRRRNASPLSTP